MHKPYNYFVLLLLALVLAYHYSGCDSDTIINNGTGELFGGYDPDEAADMMTLSALCYVAEGNTNAMQVRDSIKLQLANTNYSTAGEWQLVWGPGISPSGSNLMYV